MRITVRNSFSEFEGEVPQEALALTRELLTYKNEIEAEVGQLFYKVKIAQRMGNNQLKHACLAKIKHLQDTEYVCLIKGNTFPTGLLNIVLAGLDEIHQPYTLADFREDPGTTCILRWNNVPWDPRYYQKEMIDLGLIHKRGVFESAVGTGKSLIMGYLIKEISVNSLVIVPSKGLSLQLYSEFSAWFGYQNVQILDAEKIRKIKKVKPISICTVQSLASLKKNGEFKDFAKHIEALHIDEIHHAGSDSYVNLLEDLEHVYYRYGYTGTFLRNDNKTLSMWGVLSNRLYRYPAHKAIADGYLTPMKVHVYPMAGKAIKKYQDEYDHHYCNNPELLERIHSICGTNYNDQILILVSKKDKCGLIIHEYLNALGVDNAYISGDNSKEEINETISAFNDKKIRILIGSSVIGEGIDVRSADHLIMCQGGKSEIVMVQAAGRLVRLYPGKALAHLHDFRFIGSRYMEKHVEDRIDTYSRNFECEVEEIAT